MWSGTSRYESDILYPFISTEATSRFMHTGFAQTYQVMFDMIQNHEFALSEDISNIHC